jgi:hypothetical protein
MIIISNKKVGHPKKKKIVKRAPALDIFSLVITETDWKSYYLNQLRREKIIARKTSVKTAATADELVNLARKDAFLIAAGKALGYIPKDEPEFICREGYEELFVKPEKKASETIVWDKNNLPPDNPVFHNKSVYVIVENESKAKFIACYNYEKEQWENREGKACRNIIAHYPLNSNQE